MFNHKRKKYIIMAKKPTTSTTNGVKSDSKSKRPGVHSKKKSSNSKNAKHYKKSYKGQGR